MVYTAKCRRQDGATSIKGMPVDCLPMMDDMSWVFANQVRF
ncbi:hypothetical protein ADICYQ_0620 [Cyclobacterium qasimii M12-11B]|uniref:Uncharacterized protein n=1 Tax=Cyclobacterium qasimii M12-11B TaxID=641524 RepID=S7WW73_9BACT|nr:hypothetical protein ADICYQ_0620 [Cyclobacterium qasimii M12-11B]